MVSIVGKPCMEHILELLRDHGLTDVIVTVAFLPQAIRSYFGEGDTLGLNIGYSVEESLLGTKATCEKCGGTLVRTYTDAPPTAPSPAPGGSRWHSRSSPPRPRRRREAAW